LSVSCSFGLSLPKRFAHFGCSGMIRDTAKSFEGTRACGDL
jgi:hypothetical protein